ncbi:MAG: flavodoxin [Lachnospiraceae bacterium]|nr:flavodoxin [Lachnospiraceae bacterium]
MQKRLIGILLTFSIVCLLAGYSADHSFGGQLDGNSLEMESNNTEVESEDAPMNTETPIEKILVAYFSNTGTTKSVAEKAADILKADVYEIVPKDPYTEADLAYYTNGRADQEQDNPDARPAIAGDALDMTQYDTVLVGYPIWHGQAPRIISTFLESYDFTGKTIVPFCTSHSSGIGSSADNLHLLAEDAEWMEGRRFGADHTKEDVEVWLNEMKMSALIL